jgi:hypothetical protein
VRIRIATGAEGEIVVPPGEAESLGLAGGGQGELISARGAFALITAARGDEPVAWFAGSLAAVSVPEAVQFVFTSLKTGVLLLAFGEGRGSGVPEPERLRRKSIYFRDGQVAFASSSDRAERLGAVLRRSGMVPEAALERCSRMVRSGRPLGQVLVDEGMLTAGQLYEGISLQVKEILLDAFVETEGTFAFLEGTADERNAVKLAQRTRDLLIEGVQRVEEAETLARELGGRRVVLGRGERPRRALTTDETAMLEAANGRRDLEAVGIEAGMGQFLALQTAATLYRDHLVQVVVPPEPAAAPPEREEAPTLRLTGPFETYRRIFARVHESIAAVHLDASKRLNSYFERLPARNRAVFDGVRFAQDGDIDVSRVLENVVARGDHKGAASRARALEALEDLLAFALFEVKNCLPRADADLILREVGRMQVGKA